jgi:hypothetical protein
VGAAQAILDVERAASAHDGAAVATVGSLAVHPNASNVIPARVTLSVDVRALDADTKRRLVVFPNLSIVENAIGVVRPVAVNRTEVHWSRVSLKGAEPEAVALQMRLAEESDNFIDVDDIENWERAQEGLETVPEAEWLHTGRGLGLPSSRDDRGVETVKVTNEAPMRAYQAEWVRLMTQAPRVESPIDDMITSGPPAP